MVKLLKINGVDIKPTPSDYQPDIEILENSTRNSLGTLLREIIAYKVKINCKWSYMTQAQYQKLQEIRKLKSFSCTYWDTSTGKTNTITCYAGQPKATPIRADENGVVDWRDISMNFIEY